MSKSINARFEMNVWQRIKAACSVWWAIVVTKELKCGDDEELEIALKKIKAIENDWDNAIPECNVCYEAQKIAEQALERDQNDQS